MMKLTSLSSVVGLGIEIASQVRDRRNVPLPLFRSIYTLVGINKPNSSSPGSRFTIDT